MTIVKKYPELKDLDLASGSDHQAPEERDESHIEIKLYAEQSNEAYVVTKSDSKVDVEKIELQYDVEVKNVSGLIRKTIYEAIVSEIDSPIVAEKMSEAFKDEFTSTKGLKVESLYNFQIEQYFDHGQFIKYGNVLSASLIVGKAISKKIYQLNPENFSWMLLPENYGNSVKPFYLPVETLRVTSLFQLNRHHPVTRKYQPHNGIDFASPKGSPVHPAMEGTVITISRTRSKGKYITLRHDNGYLTTYIHLKKFEPGLRVGDRVDLDDQIGEVGRTGYATGAHLHFGVIQDGYFVNPIYLVKNYPYSQKAQHMDAAAAIDEKSINDGETSEGDLEE